MHGDLPQKAQLDVWSKKIMTHTYVHENVVDLMKTFRYDAHPMVRYQPSDLPINASARECS